MSQSNRQSSPRDSVLDDIKYHITEIDHAFEVVRRHQAELCRLIHTLLEPKPHSPLGDEGILLFNHEQPRLQSPTGANGQCCPNPGCNKGPYDVRQLRRHYQTHVYCWDVSSEDTHCARCQKPLDKVSTFSRAHTKCFEQMPDQLSQDTILKAMKQRDRLLKASNKRLRTAMRNKKAPPTNPMKRGRGPEYETSPPKIRRTEAVDGSSVLHIQVDSGNETTSSTNSVPPDYAMATVAPGLALPPSEPELASDYTEIFPASIPPELLARDFSNSHSMTGQYDERLYRRSLMMVVNPMDGLY